MKRSILILLTVFALVTSGCNLLFRLPVGGPDLIPTETFIVNEPIPDDAMITDVEITLAPSNGSVLLAGNVDELANGTIQYNIADWKPAVVVDAGTLHIEQNIPDNNISSTPKDSINKWNLKLSNTLENITVNLSTGNYTMSFAETLPEGLEINVDAGVGNLRLEFPKAITAIVDVQRGPANIGTEGVWTKDGRSYTSDEGGPVWKVEVNIGVGNLTLASQ